MHQKAIGMQLISCLLFQWSSFTQQHSRPRLSTKSLRVVSCFGGQLSRLLTYLRDSRPLGKSIFRSVLKPKKYWHVLVSFESSLWVRRTVLFCSCLSPSQGPEQQRSGCVRSLARPRLRVRCLQKSTRGEPGWWWLGTSRSNSPKAANPTNDCTNRSEMARASL